MRRETLEMTGTEEVKTCFRIGGGLVGGLLLSFGSREEDEDLGKGAWRCLCYGLGLARLWVPARKCKANLDAARKA